MLNLRGKNVVGLDIDTSAVRMVQLRKDTAGYTLVQATVADIVPWGDDPQLRHLHTSRAIQQGLAGLGTPTKHVVCGLRGSEVVVRDFEFPPLTPEEIAGAVELEVSQICPFLAEESTLDYQVTTQDDRRTMGFWVAATNGLIENTRQLVSQAGGHCALLDVVGLALLNLLDSESQRPSDADSVSAPRPASASVRQTAVLNLGDTCATIAIADSAGRPFVRDIGGGVAPQERGATRAGRGGTHGSFPAQDDGAARNDYHPLANDSLVEDVATTLRYYALQNGSTRVDRLLVCGSAGVVDDTLDRLRMRLNIEVQPWNPLTKDGGRRAEGEGTNREDAGPAAAIHDLPRYGPSLAVAAGLALRRI